MYHHQPSHTHETTDGSVPQPIATPVTPVLTTDQSSAAQPFISPLTPMPSYPLPSMFADTPVSTFAELPLQVSTPLGRSVIVTGNDRAVSMLFANNPVTTGSALGAVTETESFASSIESASSAESASTAESASSVSSTSTTSDTSETPVDSDPNRIDLPASPPAGVPNGTAFGGAAFDGDAFSHNPYGYNTIGDDDADDFGGEVTFLVQPGQPSGALHWVGAQPTSTSSSSSSSASFAASPNYGFAPFRADEFDASPYAATTWHRGQNPEHTPAQAQPLRGYEPIQDNRLLPTPTPAPRARKATAGSGSSKKSSHSAKNTISQERDYHEVLQSGNDATEIAKQQFEEIVEKIHAKYEAHKELSKKQKSDLHKKQEAFYQACDVLAQNLNNYCSKTPRGYTEYFHILHQTGIIMSNLTPDNISRYKAIIDHSYHKRSFPKIFGGLMLVVLGAAVAALAVTLTLASFGVFSLPGIAGTVAGTGLVAHGAWIALAAGAASTSLGGTVVSFSGRSTLPTMYKNMPKVLEKAQDLERFTQKMTKLF